MSAFVVFVVAAAALVSVGANRDLFSPAKFFLASFVLFHAGAWARPVELELWLLVLLVASVGVLTVAIEAYAERAPARAATARRRWPAPSPVRRDPAAALLWLLTLPAIVAQWYIIDAFGGLFGYLAVLGNRVLEFRGLGWVRTLTSMLLVVNLVYFAIGLVERRRGAWWLGYLLHLLLLVGIGLLSGSRSGVLTVFAMQLFLLHYLRRRLRLASVAVVAVVLVAGAGVLGVVREGLKVDEDEVSTGLGGDSPAFQTGVFSYGVEPLQLLLRQDRRELELGSTFATVLTNPVPRALWPGKPDTGGVVFTQRYTGDAWEGASNLTPTFLGEWVLNFGWLAGAPLFVLSYVVLMALVVRSYLRLRLRLRLASGVDRRLAIDTVRYVCVLWAVVGLMVGEFTNVVLGLVLNQLLPLALIQALLRPRRRPVIAAAATA